MSFAEALPSQTPCGWFECLLWLSFLLSEVQTGLDESKFFLHSSYLGNYDQ